MILYPLFYSLMFPRILFYCVFLSGTLCDVNKYCNPNVCQKNQQHTLCTFQTAGPASHCLGYELTIRNDKDRELILHKINGRRDKVASGVIRSLPPAEDMFKMEWNEELAESAQRWADQCVSNTAVGEVEDHCRDLDNMKVGQNVATVYGEAPGLTPSTLVDVWYMQLLNVNASLLSRYQLSNEGSSAYNYFTQLVWAASYQVGCGGVKFKEHFEDTGQKKHKVVYRLVCNFAPQGNQLDEAVYTAGKVGAKCTYGTSETYKSLCNTQTDVEETEPDEVVITTDIIHIDNDSTTYNQSTALTTDDSTIIELYGDDNATFDYFSHLYELTKDHLTSTTLEKPKCKNDVAVDEIVELVKNKLTDDPALRLFFKTTVSTSTGSIVKDEKIAAFLNKIYNKATPPSKAVTTSTEFVNSTLLVNLVEAVMFRNTDEIKEKVTPEIEIGSYVNPIKVQAVSAVKPNYDITGHYFFPEYDGEETIRQTTETDYEIPYESSAQDVIQEIEEIRKNRPTRDFLDEILETESVVESTTRMKHLSPDDMKLQTAGYSNMRNFLKDIAEKSESLLAMPVRNETDPFKRKKRKNKVYGPHSHLNINDDGLFSMSRFYEIADKKHLNSQMSINHYSEFLENVISDSELNEIEKRHYFSVNKCTKLIPIASMSILFLCGITL